MIPKVFPKISGTLSLGKGVACDPTYLWVACDPIPTLLGRVASDPLVLFLWPCSLKNTSPRILFLVVACDPTYLFGRVASDHFLALAIPKHLPWPDLHSDRIWPYSPTCHRKHGFCVAGATISMPLRCSPLTLYMLVGKCQMAFVWQVQQFWCLWDDLPWPYTCWLGSVKWLLCGRCNNFDASEMFSPDPIHACWEGSHGFCVAGAAILMPLRWSRLRWRGNAIFQWFYLDYIGVDAHHFTGLPWCRCFFPYIMISGWKITHEFLPTEQGFLSRAMPFFLFRVKWSVWCVVWPYLCSALYMDQKVGRRPVVTWIIESMGCRGGGKFW